jgi:tetratricopeptide (TPR) repeat protein
MHGRETRRKIGGLLQQGRGLFRHGRLQQAIHVWTRILFLDRNNRAAREAIEQAKRMIAERQRELDALVLEAARREAAGDRRGAQQRLSRVLALDPRHAEGRSLWEKIDEHERRGEARSGSLSMAGKPPEDDEVSKSQRRKVVVRRTAETKPASPLKMAAFLFSALCLFAAGGLYLHLNWDFLVSDGRPATTSVSTGADPLDPQALPSLPSLSELHYFNGARLHSKGLYREALSELSLVDRESPTFEEARSLILRIEERLLRGSVMAGVPAAPLARNPKGE